MYKRSHIQLTFNPPCGNIPTAIHHHTPVKPLSRYANILGSSDVVRSNSTPAPNSTSNTPSPTSSTTITQHSHQTWDSPDFPILPRIQRAHAPSPAPAPAATHPEELYDKGRVRTSDPPPTPKPNMSIPRKDRYPTSSQTMIPTSV